jgi:hypothetical protein
MKHKSHVAAGGFLIIPLSLVAFLCHSLILYSVLPPPPKQNKTEQLQRAQGNDIEYNLMTFFHRR